MNLNVDATELEELRIIKERYDLALEGANDGVWDWNVISGEAFFSNRFKLLVGYSQSMKLDGMESLIQVVHPDDLQPTLDAIDAHFSKIKPYIHEFRLKTVNHGYRWFLVRGQACWNEEGVVYRMAGTLTDIHDWVMNRQALKQAGDVHLAQENRFKQLVKSLPDMLLQLNSQGVIVDLHLPQGSTCIDPSVLRKNILDVFPSDLSEELLSRMGEVLRSEVATSFDYDIKMGEKTNFYSTRIVPYISQESVLLIIRDITETQVNKEKLEESISLSSTIIERMTDGFVLLDTKGSHIQVNDAFCKLVGYTEEELIGTGLPHIYWVKGKEKDMMSIFYDVLNHKKKEVEFDIQRKDGTLVSVIVAPTILLNQDGTIRSSYATVKDISSIRKIQNELELLNSELEHLVEERTSQLIKKDKMFEQAQELVNLGSFEWNLSREEVIWSSKMFEIYGLDPKDGVPTRDYLRSTVPLEELSFVDGVIRNSIMNNEPYEIETRLIRKNGELRTVLVNALPEYNASGEAERIIGVMKDITEQKEKESSLKRLGDTLELATKQSGVGVWEWFPDTNELIWNSTMFKIYEIDASQFHGYETWKRSVHPDDLERVEEEQRIGMMQSSQFSNSFRIIHPDGSIHFLQSNGNGRFDSNGSLISVLGTNWDVTKDKQIEQTLREINDELESFSYSVSHDLRAPLRGIDGWSLALLEDYGHLLDDKGKVYLQRVRQQTQEMGGLIDNILDLSRIKRVGFSPKKVFLDKLFFSAVEKWFPEYPVVQISVDEKGDYIEKGDAKLLGIMMNNLVENAMKFSSKVEKPEIHFKQIVIDGKSCFVLEDNGVGFNSNDAKNLFAPFQRFHKKADFPGTGIGLATCQRVIRIHEGDIWIESNPGEGTKVFFSIGNKMLS